jgi:hypothetical protein
MKYDQIIEKVIVSYDFHSKKEYDEYMDAHPKADKSNHKIVDLITKKDKNDSKIDKIREKVEEHTTKEGDKGSVDIKISGSCDMVRNLVSAIGGKSTRVEEDKSGRCAGFLKLNEDDAKRLLSSVRGN